MNFDLLPDNIFLEIIRYLPLEDQVRVGRVSKRFRQFSTSAVAETKSLDLDKEPYSSMSPYSLTKLLEKCSTTLEEIRFDDFDGAAQLVAFSQFSCPHLVELDMDSVPLFGSNVLADLFTNNPNLRSIWYNNRDTIEEAWRVEFPDVICENMESVSLPYNMEASFVESFVEHCPNLKDLVIGFEEVVSVSAAAFDGIFAHCHQLEKLEMLLFGRHILLMNGNLVNFRQLDALRHLSLSFPSGGVNENALINIATLTQLEQLEIAGNWYQSISDQGISALATLTNLRSLSFIRHRLHVGMIIPVFDNGARLIAGNCRQLEYVEFGFSLSSPVVLYFVQRCPKLEWFDVNDIVDITTPAEAVALYSSIGDICFRELKIIVDGGARRIWRSDELAAARKKVNKGKNYELFIGVRYFG